MDVKQYFRRLREIEAGITDEYPVIVSVETPDGGKAGLVSEVSRANAAKLMAEGRAILADSQQIELLRTKQAEATEAAQFAELTRQVQVAFISESELQARKADRKSRGGK